VAGVVVVPAGVADPRREHSRLFTDQVLHAPEASAGQNRLARIGHASSFVLVIIGSMYNPPSGPENPPLAWRPFGPRRVTRLQRISTMPYLRLRRCARYPPLGVTGSFRSRRKRD